MTGEIAEHTVEAPGRVRNKPPRFALRLVIGLVVFFVVVGFIGGLLVSSKRGVRAPAVVTFVGWTNVPGSGKYALISLRNTSNRRLFRFGYCEIDGEGITQRIVDFPRAYLRVESEQNELLQVAVPAAARGEVRFRFHVTVPRTFAQNAAEAVDELLVALKVNSSSLKQFYENRWALTCSANVER